MFIIYLSNYINGGSAAARQEGLLRCARGMLCSLCVKQKIWARYEGRNTYLRCARSILCPLCVKQKIA